MHYYTKKVIEAMHNERMSCTRSTTHESNAMIEALKEKWTIRMKNKNGNDYNFKEELNRSINEFRHETRNH